MQRLLYTAGVNHTTQTPIHYGAITSGSTIRAWHVDSGAISINQSRFRLIDPTCITITSTHRPNHKAAKSTPLMAIGTKHGLIHLISLTTGELLQTLRQTPVQTQNQIDQAKPSMSVQDLIWSKDGQILYSLAKRHIFEWHIGQSTLSQHKRFNIFGLLNEYLNHNGATMDQNLFHLLDIQTEALTHMKLNYNQDKIILAGIKGVYVYCLRTNSILAKYYGYLGKVVSLSIDTPLNQLQHQQHHHFVQNQFKNGDFVNNDMAPKATEFFIAVATNQDSNVSIYQYPPIQVAESEKVIMKRAKAPTTDSASTSSKSKKSAKDEDHFTTTLFQLSSRESVRCTLPNRATGLNLTLLYDEISTYLPDAQPTTPTNVQHLFKPISFGYRPRLILAATTSLGNACTYDIPSRQEFIQQDSTSSKKKSASVTTYQPTTSFSSPTVMVHDPSLTNSHYHLSAKEDSTDAYEAAKSLRRGAKSNTGAKGAFKTHILQEGAIVGAALIDLSRMYIIRSSTIRPRIEIVKLCGEASKDVVSRLLYIPHVSTIPQTSFDCTAHNQKVIRYWTNIIPVEKLRVSANGDYVSARTKDQVIFDAVKSVSNGTVLVPTSKLEALSKVSSSSTAQLLDGESTESFIKRTKDKRQKLLHHVSQLNTQLKHILESSQNTTGPLTISAATPDSLASTFAQFSALQGTLCGVLVQSLKSDDDATIEQTIKYGVQGINTQAGWTNLTKYLNNPEAMAQLDVETEVATQAKQKFGTNFQVDPNAIATMSSANYTINFKQLAAGKTLIQTVRLLPQQFVVQFLTVLTTKLASSPLRAFELLPWIHVIVRLHSMYLLSVPSVHDILRQVSSLLKQRTNTLNNVVQLKGRLEVILTQFNNAQQQANRKQMQKQKVQDQMNNFLPSNVYNEQAELEDGFFGLGSVQNEYNGDNEEDDVDMFDTTINHKKRKRRPSTSVDNFKMFGLKADNLEEDDEDEDDFDMDSMMDTDMMGFGEDGEGEFDMSMFDYANEGDNNYAEFDEDDDFDEDGDEFDLDDEDL